VEIARASRLSLREPARLVPAPICPDTYATPIVRDPFSVAIAEKAELALALTDGLLSAGFDAIQRAWAQLSFSREARVFASTEGAQIEQTLYRSYAAYGCLAVGNGDAQSRSYELPPLNCGYEHIERDRLLGEVERVAAEAVEKLRAPEGPPSEATTLILLPTNLYLTIHESVGHPTELDRVFGYEANFAGTSFATPDQLGRLRYAAPWVNFTGDRTLPGGRATVGYDDEGVPAQRWPLIREGILVDYLTERSASRPASPSSASPHPTCSILQARCESMATSPSRLSPIPSPSNAPPQPRIFALSTSLGAM